MSEDDGAPDREDKSTTLERRFQKLVGYGLWIVLFWVYKDHAWAEASIPELSFIFVQFLVALIFTAALPVAQFLDVAKAVAEIVRAVRGKS